MNQEQLSLLLSFIFLTILLVVIILIILEENSAYKKRIDNGYYRNDMVKEIKKTKVDNGLNENNNYYIQQTIKPKKSMRIDTFIYINKEEEKTYKYSLIKKNSRGRKFLRGFFDVLFTAILLSFIGFVLFTKINNDQILVNGRTYVTVETSSMAKIYEENTYLEANDLHNQLPVYSLIGLDKVNENTEINLWDICAYKDSNNNLIIHRIIKVEERNGITYYTFRGDNNPNSDYFLIKKEEVLYKFNGYCDEFAGRFVSYIKSPIGITVICYVAIALFVLDFSESKKEKHYRKKIESMVDELNAAEDKFVSSLVPLDKDNKVIKNKG